MRKHNFIANKELVFQNAEKEKRAAELSIANKELIFQNAEKEKRAAELSIITTEPNSLLERFHDRMPVILTKEEEKVWLSTDVPAKDIVDICNHSFPDELMHAYRYQRQLILRRGAITKALD
jgi:hypothetical protein